MNNILKTDIQYLPGVGPKRAELLNKQLGISSYYDLLYYFPFRYIDRSKIYKICEITKDMPYIQLKGRFLTLGEQGVGIKRRINGLFNDGTGNIECVWFNSVKYVQQNIRTNTDYIIFGKPSIFNNHFSISHPEIDPVNEEISPSGMQGVYSLTDTMRKRGFAMKTLRQLIESVLKIASNIQETLPLDIIQKYRLMPLSEALVNIHQPTSIEALHKAQERLKFDELFYLQLNILRYTKSRNASIRGFVFGKVGDPFLDFYNHHLPFALTEAQKRVIKEVRTNMLTGHQMNRLIQGDVGSGKTLVAFLCMLIAAGNNFQSCLMAPTEILATQHYNTLREMADKIGIQIDLLIGSTPKKQRVSIHEGLQNGTTKILIGTHAVIEDNVQFNNLGLVVIDEQHRFGVAQRAKLWRKNSTPPHVLVMTATPIPRTLAMTVYGDLDVSVIDELPPGRKPVTTVLCFDEQREQMLQFLGKQLKQGRQIYIVYPLIHENEKLDLQNLEEGYEYICDKFPHYRVCFVHGQMKPKEKDFQMQQFLNKEADIMVATTVIEVGVNVPNASVMVIENAERFGLSQLHQLRGRVGRGADQSYCILMSHPKLSATTRKRLGIMTETNDGFRIAEADMEMRGAGDLEGTQQSGIAFDLKISSLAKDGQIVALTRKVAEEIIAQDPHLELPHHAMLAQNLRDLFSRQFNWSLIS